MWPWLRKRGSDEEKSDFEFLAFLVLYYIKKACVNILWQYLKYFSRYDHLYINLTTNLAFVFNWYFLIFITHSQIYNFLIVWLRLLVFGICIHQLIWIHCSWLFFFTCDLYLKVKLQTVIWKYRVLLITFLSLGLDFKFILYRYMYIMYNVINRTLIGYVCWILNIIFSPSKSTTIACWKL
jgi:hypothetical protein